MNTNDVLELARKHLGGEMESSARFCLEQAIDIYNSDRKSSIPSAARRWALRSLSYSVGIAHPDYIAANK